MAALVAATVLLPAAVATGQTSAASSDATAAGAPAAPTYRLLQLSDPVKVSRWAYPTRRASIRANPVPGSTTVGHLHLATEDDLPEVYLLLSRRQGSDGSDWVHLRVPGRPNGRTGWVPRDALGDFHQVTTSLVVNRRLQHVTVRSAGRVVAQFPVGVGKPSTPTPAGYFWIREKFHVRPGTLYGPRALGTAAYAPHLTDWPNGGVVGFHGTDQPQLVPGRPSHGCIRLRNADVLKLYRLVPIGTPVRIV